MTRIIFVVDPSLPDAFVTRSDCSTASLSNFLLLFLGVCMSLFGSCLPCIFASVYLTLPESLNVQI